MAKNPLILTFDCGTQSMRGLIFNSKGDLLAKEVESYPPYPSPKTGYIEQNVEVFYDKLCVVSNRLHENYPELWKDIKGMTVTSFRNTAVCIDKDLKPLRPCIMWSDQRLADSSEPIPPHSYTAFKAVGMMDVMLENRRLAKSNWIRQNEPEIWKNTYKYIQVSGYLTLRLTGKVIDSMASQVGHLPFDFKKKKWMSRMNIKQTVFNIERSKLTNTVLPGEKLGKVSKEASADTGIPAGLVIIATGSDKSCETLGTGCLDSHTASLSFGTAASVQICTEKYVEPESFLPAYPSIAAGYYNPEVQIFRGYWMITWFINEFAREISGEAAMQNVSAEELLEPLLSSVPAGSDGLMVQPYWGAQLKHPEMRGSIVGFTGAHTKAHVYRAIIEGINFGLIDAMKTLSRRSGNEIKQVTLSGGGSRSDVICQLTADMFGLPVYRVQTYETSGLGSSICGFVGLGVFKDCKEGIENMVRPEKPFVPNIETAKEYEKIYSTVYRDLYKQLKPVYKAMSNL